MAGPLFNLRLRLAVRQELRARRMGVFQIQDRMAELTDDVIDSAVASAGATEAVFALENGVNALGDGTILKAIIDFFKSDLGQAIIKLILGLLI